MKKQLVLLAFVAIFLSFLVSCTTSVISFKIEPASHNFGQVNIGTTSTFDFVITNKKSVDMTLTVVNFSTGEFSEITGAQGKSITSKGTLLITVQFSPVLPGGNKSDKMVLQWTDVNGKTGTKNIDISGEAVPVPIINAPTTYDFGTVGIGQTASHNFDIENTGSADLILSLFNFNGNATLFSITAGGTTPVTIIPGATHSVTVQYAPTATGSFPTVMEITHNAGNVATPAEITISAAGGGGRIEFNQTSPWDFGQVATGGNATDVVEISNTGSIDLTISNISVATGTAYSIDKIEDSSGNPATTPIVITPADFIEVTIKFAPTTAGNYNDTLNIAHDGSYIASPATLSLEGVGRAPVTQTFNYTGTKVNWNVPAGAGSINIECWGAQGGGTGHGIPGKGARMKGDFSVNPGQTIAIAVGQEGITGGQGGGGGGGSFVFDGNSPMIVAGAGGGSHYNNGGLNGKDGVTTQTCTPHAGTGNGYTGGSGGSWNRDGANGDYGCTGGKGWNNGLTGGTYANGGGGHWSNGNGGFGGGGGGCWAPGSGGGYNGGVSATSYGNQTPGGTGGGSINNGTNQSNTAGVKTGNGQIIVTY